MSLFSQIAECRRERVSSLASWGLNASLMGSNIGYSKARSRRVQPMKAGRRNSDESPQHEEIRTSGTSLSMHELSLALIMLLISNPRSGWRDRMQGHPGQEVMQTL